jgi:hypothetical protein
VSTNDKPQLILVTWIDSAKLGGDGPWKDKHTVTELTHDTVQSVGWIMREDEDTLVVAAHISEGQVSGEMAIPIRAILKRKKLR